MSGTNPQQSLHDFRPTAEFFVGIDSDGCAFDTMEVKHKECFIPSFVDVFGLAAVSRFARDVAEFVNLYSIDRGINRFPGYLKVLDLLETHPQVVRRGFRVPRRDGLREWIGKETTLSNSTLEQEVERTGSNDLGLALEWSRLVNDQIRRTVRGVPPFPLVRETLACLRGRADAMVVSATPGEALRREWAEHGLAELVDLIAGQEMGSKRELLAEATSGRYQPDRVLMIGDAPGDLKAAETNGVLFYPIDPGDEGASWRRLHDEALARFFGGSYAGAYMEERVARFQALLPSHPPWG